MIPNTDVCSTVPPSSRLDAINLMIAECRAIHAQCDFLGVPTHAFAQRLSISQRVASLVVLLQQKAQP